MGHGDALAGESIPGGSARGGCDDVEGRKDCGHLLRAGRTIWKLAAVGGDGSGESCHGSAGAIFRGGAGQPRDYREYDQPRLGRGQRAEQLAGSIPNRIARMAGTRMDAHGALGYTVGHWQRGGDDMLRGGGLDHRPVDRRGRRRGAGGRALAAGIPRDSETEGGGGGVVWGLCHGGKPGFTAIREAFAPMTGLGRTESAAHGATLFHALSLRVISSRFALAPGRGGLWL